MSRLCNPYNRDDWERWETMLRTFYRIDDACEYKNVVTAEMEFWVLWALDSYLRGVKAEEVRRGLSYFGFIFDTFVWISFWNFCWLVCL